MTLTLPISGVTLSAMRKATLATVRRADDTAIAEAAAIIRRGGLVAFPTETVYGLGCAATDDSAVAKIFAAKGRPRFNPLIVHVRDADQARHLGVFSDLAERLAARFWPGALTLVIPRQGSCPISLLASAGLDTIALRVPSHPVPAALIAAAGVPIAAPSANRSGRLSATAAADVAEEFGDVVELILDDGPAPLGLESTILGFESGRPVLLRPGAIPRDLIENITGPLMYSKKERVEAPGQLASHYAPRASVRLNARHVTKSEALLAFGPPSAVPLGACSTLNLSEEGDLTEAAANLFAMLRRLDASGADMIAVMPIPQAGLGEAINDRLERAAAPRIAP